MQPIAPLTSQRKRRTPVEWKLGHTGPEPSPHLSQVSQTDAQLSKMWRRSTQPRSLPASKQKLDDLRWILWATPMKDLLDELHLCVDQGNADPVIMEEHAALWPIVIQLLTKRKKGRNYCAFIVHMHYLDMFKRTYIHKQSQGYVIFHTPFFSCVWCQVRKPGKWHPILVKVRVQMV